MNPFFYSLIWGEMGRDEKMWSTHPRAGAQLRPRKVGGDEVCFRAGRECWQRHNTGGSGWIERRSGGATAFLPPGYSLSSVPSRPLTPSPPLFSQSQVFRSVGPAAKIPPPSPPFRLLLCARPAPPPWPLLSLSGRTHGLADEWE